jgi:hypothetical protein
LIASRASLWWPVTDRRYKLGVDELSYYHIVRASHGVRTLARLCLAEAVLFGPILVFTVLMSRRRFRARC